MTIELSVQNVTITLGVLALLIPLLLHIRVIGEGIVCGFQDWLWEIKSDWKIHISVMSGIFALFMIHPSIHGHFMARCSETFFDVILCIVSLVYIGLGINFGHANRKRGI